jgi:hypothetical protein
VDRFSENPEIEIIINITNNENNCNTYLHLENRKDLYINNSLIFMLEILVGKLLQHVQENRQPSNQFSSFLPLKFVMDL